MQWKTYFMLIMERAFGSIENSDKCTIHKILYLPTVVVSVEGIELSKNKMR